MSIENAEKDPPGSGEYLKEQSTDSGGGNVPGAVCYELREGEIYRMNDCNFGEGDLYYSMWHILGLAGIDTNEWRAQYNYWRRPQKLDDGGENILD